MVDGSFMEEEKCDVIMSDCFYVEVGVGGSSNTGAPSIFRFCMSSHVDKYIVIIVILDTNWSAWNFDQNT